MGKKKFYTITKGEVTKKKYSNYKFKKKNISRMTISVCILFVLLLCLSFLIFSKAISNKDDFSQQLSIGAIFATFGAALVSIGSLKMNLLYDEFKSNLGVLFKQIDPDAEWYRWPFIKRKSEKKLFNGEVTTQEVVNSSIQFKVGSHSITVFLPTILKDFFELKVFTYYFLMKRNAADYESFVIYQAAESGDDYNISDNLMFWECVYANYKVIVEYILWNYSMKAGIFLIIDSIILGFGYSFIQDCLNRLFQLIILGKMG